MKKINFKKALASVAALSVVACMAAVPASAADKVSVKIDQKTITVDDAKAKTPVPIYVRLDAVDTGVSAIEYGIQVDTRCTYTFIDDSDDAQDLGGESLSFVMTLGDSKGTPGLSWLTYAASKPTTKALRLALFMVTVPETAKAGDQYDIKYVPEAGSPELWRNENEGIEYGSANFVNGWIKIEGEPDETDATTASTEATDATTASTEASTASTVNTDDATDDTNNTSDTVANTDDTNNTSASSTTTTTTTGTGTGTGTNSNSSTGSPDTGSADVLPIAGAAAAVAVLGGVALVAKKKND